MDLKTSIVVRKLVLDCSPDYNFLLYAIVSYEQDFKLVWDINNKLQMDFIRTDDYAFFHKKMDRNIEFSSFIYEDSERYLNYRLISNFSEQGLFLDELKGIDFILMISGDYTGDFPSAFQKSLQTVKSIRSIFKIDPMNLKSKERLQGGLS